MTNLLLHCYYFDSLPLFALNVHFVNYPVYSTTLFSPWCIPFENVLGDRLKGIVLDFIFELNTTLLALCVNDSL